MIGREFSRLSRSINSERGTVPGRIIGLRILDASRSKPGYGKTTLLSQWAERNGQAFAWVSVDETDNDPKMLLSYVAEALDRVEPIGGRVFEALAHPKVIMQILRHAQISVTMEIYSQAPSGQTREALRRLSESLDS